MFSEFAGYWESPKTVLQLTDPEAIKLTQAQDKPTLQKTHKVIQKLVMELTGSDIPQDQVREEGLPFYDDIAFRMKQFALND